VLSEAKAPYLYCSTKSRYKIIGKEKQAVHQKKKKKIAAEE